MAVPVTVVVITHNRRDELVSCLRRLRSLPEHPAVVVVDNASTDGSPAAARAAHPQATVIALPANRGAAGRNVGLAVASTPYVAFCDDDTWWEPGSLRRAAEVLDAHPRTAVLTAHIVVEPAGVEDPVCVELRDSPLPRPDDLPGPPLLSFLAGASVVRRAAVLSVGGFEPKFFVGGEEELLACDLAGAGWAMAHRPDMVIHHRASAARDPHRRRRTGIRNTLWFSWLRRPTRSAVRRTVAMLNRVPADSVSLGGFADAAAGVGWVARHRRVTPPGVEHGLRLLDGVQLSGEARRYVS